jgi:transposase InsO family protein
MDKVEQDKAVITLVTPLRTAAPWMPRLCSMAVVPPVHIPYTRAALLSFGTNYRDFVTPPWGGMLVWRIAGSPRTQEQSAPLEDVVVELEKWESAALAALYAPSVDAEPSLLAMTLRSAPSDDQKKHIALLKHLEGHVGIAAMVAKLKDDGHAWEHMPDLCQAVIRDCPGCQIHKLENPKFHAMRAVVAFLPMDHLAIDTHTMSVSSSGYNILLSVVDMCTRFVWLRALKDKTAASVAYALWEICANFGFPKVMQSDNGTEFVNKVVRELKIASSIDHRLTTPYNPKANGVVERSFRTIMESIRIFCEGASHDWLSCVPQTQLWLNLRSSKLHGFTPFSLMFSRPFVGFHDFSAVPLDQLSPEALEKRYNVAFNFMYPEVRRRTEATVAKRTGAYNKRRGVSLEPFPNGSYVMLRIAKRQSKLGQQYRGPFLVLRRTRGGSYVLQDTQGDLFPRNAAPSQLKLVSFETIRNALDAGEQVLEVDQLLAHRGKPGAREYKVRWAGYDQEADTWEKASQIEPSLIYTYWERRGEEEGAGVAAAMASKGAQGAASDDETAPEDDVPPPPRKRGRPPGKSTTGAKKRSVVGPVKRGRGRPKFC